jgi:hypothetical protein
MIDKSIGMVFFAISMALIFAVGGGAFYTWKNVQVWSASKSGEAILAEAKFSRQARVEQARAKAAAADLEGQAELTRAQFAAKANAELANGLGGPEAYLRYMYIRMLEEQGGTGQVIYIPTEGGMPILEAGKRP